MFPSLASLLLTFFAFSAQPTQGQAGVSADTQEDTTPAAAFAAMLAEIDAQKPKSPAEWEEKQKAFLSMVKERLQNFAKKYPEAEEAYEARFQLAQIAAQVDNQLDEAIKGLEACVKELAAKEDRKELRAKGMFLLARVQIEAAQYAEARKNLAEIRSSLPDSPLAQAASSMLAQLDAGEKLAIGKPILPFEAPGLDGKKWSPKSFEGKVLLIDFWATWCGPCRKEMPHVKKTYEEFHSKGFEILAVSLDESEEKLRNYVKDEKLPWAQCFDGKGWENEVAGIYGIKSIPATFLVDRMGKIRYKNLRGDELKKRVAELIAEEVPAKK